MTITLRVLNGMTGGVVCELALSAEAVIADVRGVVQSKAAMPNADHHLYFEGQLLQDDCRLKDIAMSDSTDEDVCVDIKLVLSKLITSFEDFGLKEDLLRGVRDYGFDKPSMLQIRALRPMLGGRDILVEAQSGTGKTATYVVAALDRMKPERASTQVLVLAPTRELSCPIQKVAAALGDHMRVRSHCCDFGDDGADALFESPHFVVGTPGRVAKMVADRRLSLDDVSTFVLDEMDNMMQRGYKGLILETVELLPPHVQLAVFSATMPADILEYLKSKMRDPLRVTVRREELSMEGVRQFYVAVDAEEKKLDTLRDLYGALPAPTIILYCNTRRKCDFVAGRLMGLGFAISVLHAELDQGERDLVMQGFRSGTSCILLSTDLLARGLADACGLQCDLVINYDFPQSFENYLYRAGHTGTPGQRAVISLVGDADARAMRDVEAYYRIQIMELPEDFGGLI